MPPLLIREGFTLKGIKEVSYRRSLPLVLLALLFRDTAALGNAHVTQLREFPFPKHQDMLRTVSKVELQNKPMIELPFPSCPKKGFKSLTSLPLDWPYE